MRIDGTFSFAGPRQAVWNLLQDPAVLARTLPGTERLTQTADGTYEGVMKVSVGPMTAARFDVRVALYGRVPPERYTMTIDGKGAVGFTTGTAEVTLHEEAGATTRMQYAADVQIGGRIASVGQRLLDSVARTMMRQAFDALQRELRAQLGAADA